jgi:hypothetical protein
VAKYRNISGVDIRGPFIPGEYAEAGEVVELPDEQTDGSPLVHPTDVWEPVDRKAKAAVKAADKAADDAVKADEEVEN